MLVGEAAGGLGELLGVRARGEILTQVDVGRGVPRVGQDPEVSHLLVVTAPCEKLRDVEEVALTSADTCSLGGRRPRDGCAQTSLAPLLPAAAAAVALCTAHSELMMTRGWSATSAPLGQQQRSSFSLSAGPLIIPSRALWPQRFLGPSDTDLGMGLPRDPDAALHSHTLRCPGVAHDPGQNWPRSWPCSWQWSAEATSPQIRGAVALRAAALHVVSGGEAPPSRQLSSPHPLILTSHEGLTFWSPASSPGASRAGRRPSCWRRAWRPRRGGWSPAPKGATTAGPWDRGGVATVSRRGAGHSDHD